MMELIDYNDYGQSVECDECHNKVDIIVNIGEETLGEYTAWICKECLEKALLLFDSDEESE